MAGHFEAKKIAWRQTKDGLVLALSIHPDDVSPEMSLAPLNTRFMIAFSEIGDDEKPVDRKPPSEAAPSGSKPFSSLPLSQQAGIRCADRQFQTFMAEKHFAQSLSDEGAAEQVRFLCHIKSRADLDDNLQQGANIWYELENEFQQWLTDQRYAGSKR